MPVKDILIISDQISNKMSEDDHEKLRIMGYPEQTFIKSKNYIIVKWCNSLQEQYDLFDIVYLDFARVVNFYWDNSETFFNKISRYLKIKDKILILGLGIDKKLLSGEDFQDTKNIQRLENRINDLREDSQYWKDRKFDLKLFYESVKSHNFDLTIFKDSFSKDYNVFLDLQFLFYFKLPFYSYFINHGQADNAKFLKILKYNKNCNWIIFNDDSIHSNLNAKYSIKEIYSSETKKRQKIIAGRINYDNVSDILFFPPITKHIKKSLEIIFNFIDESIVNVPLSFNKVLLNIREYHIKVDEHIVKFSKKAFYLIYYFQKQINNKENGWINYGVPAIATKIMRFLEDNGIEFNPHSSYGSGNIYNTGYRDVNKKFQKQLGTNLVEKDDEVSGRLRIAPLFHNMKVIR